jgi:hypothetical protein
VATQPLCALSARIRINNKTNITPVLEKIQDYKRNLIQHVNQMPRNRLHRLLKKTTPKKAEGTKEDH